MSIRDYETLKAAWGNPIPSHLQLAGSSAEQLRRWSANCRQREDHAMGKKTGDGYWECREQWYQKRSVMLEGEARRLAKETDSPLEPRKPGLSPRYHPYCRPSSPVEKPSPRPTPCSPTGLRVVLPTAYEGTCWNSAPIPGKESSLPDSSPPSNSTRMASPTYRELTSAEDVINLDNLTPPNQTTNGLNLISENY